MFPKITKTQAEIGIVAGFLIIASPIIVGFPNSLISTSIIGSLISLTSSAFLGHLKFKENQPIPTSEAL
jgi:hypothetical protein